MLRSFASGARPIRRRAILRRLGLSGFVFVGAPLAGGVAAERAIYRGGTLAAPRQDEAGVPLTSDPVAFVFRHERGELRVAYSQVNLLEYGQKAGRRLGLSIAVSPLFLLSKKHRHYLTIGFRDEAGEQQAAVFELGKKTVRSTLAGLEARTGIRIEYENEQARQAARR
jgi:hypothetical protein